MSYEISACKVETVNEKSGSCGRKGSDSFEHEPRSNAKFK